MLQRLRHVRRPQRLDLVGIQHRTTPPESTPARVVPSRACCTAHPRYGKTASLVFWSFPQTQGLPRPSGVGLSEDLGGLLSRKHRVGLPVWHRRERASSLAGSTQPPHASRADHPTVRPSDREIGVWGREATFSAFEFFASSKFHPAFVSLESLMREEGNTALSSSGPIHATRQARPQRSH